VKSDQKVFFPGVVVLAGFQVGHFHPHGAYGSVTEPDFPALGVGFEGASADAGGVQTDAAGLFGKSFTGDFIAFGGFFSTTGIQFGHEKLLKRGEEIGEEAS
jgi:hypothetical protein